MLDKLPVLDWLADYESSDVQGDLAAGATVGVMLIPQGMAYAVIAGVPPIYGLYAGLIPLLAYPLFGTAKHLSVGPVGVDMLIIGTGVGAVAAGPDEHLAFAILVAAMTGLIEIAMATLRMGFLVNLLSRPVIAGFMTAAPLIIAASQLGNFLGVELVDSQYVHMQIWSAWQHLDQVAAAPVTIGAVGVLFLLALQRFWPKLPGALIWVVLATGAAYLFDFGSSGVDVVGDVPGGLPAPQLQAFDWETIRQLGSTAATLAVVQFMSVISLGQAFAAQYDYEIDANRELFAIGTANFLGSFFQSIPVSGSFSRSAVNDRAGANSPLANVVTAAVIGLTLLMLTPLFRTLPIPALAAIIIVACVGMIDIRELRTLGRERPTEAAVAAFTCVATLGIGIQAGILLGIGVSVMLVLYRVSRPDLVELGHVPGTRDFRDLDREPEAEPIEGVDIVRIDSRFAGPDARSLERRIDARDDDEEPHSVVIDASGMNRLDAGAVEALEYLMNVFDQKEMDYYIAGAKAPVREVLRRSGLQEQIGEDRFFLNPNLAVQEILRKREGTAEDYEPFEEKHQELELASRRQELEEQRAELEETHDTAREERQRVREEIEEYEAARRELQQAEEKLEDEIERAEARENDLQERRRDVEEAHEDLEEKADELDEREEELEEQREQLEERRQKAEREEEALQEDWEPFSDDVEQLRAERERLRRELEDHEAEREELESLYQRLHERLNEADQRKEALSWEADRLEEQREDIEAKRKRLEAERRKAGEGSAPSENGDDAESGDDTEEEGS